MVISSSAQTPKNLSPPPARPKGVDNTDALAAEKLLGLLASMFEVSEFRMWIHFGPNGPALLSRLLEGSYTASQFYYEAVRAIYAERPLGREFVERLISVRPQRAGEIRAIDMAAVNRTLAKGFRPQDPGSKTRVVASLVVIALLVIGNGLLVAYIGGIGPFLIRPPPVEDRPAGPVEVALPAKVKQWLEDFDPPSLSPPPPSPEIQRLQGEMKEQLLKLAANSKSSIGKDQVFDAHLFIVQDSGRDLWGSVCPKPDGCVDGVAVKFSGLDATQRELAFRSRYSEGSKQPILTFRGKYRRDRYGGEEMFVSSIELKRLDGDAPLEAPTNTP